VADTRHAGRDRVTATDPRTAAIEAGARVMFAEFQRQLPVAAQTHAWEDMTEAGKFDWLRDVAHVYDAMAPLIRAAVAEEIALAIEAKHVSARLHKTCIPCEVGSAAAAIAREHATVPVSVVPADSAGDL